MTTEFINGAIARSVPLVDRFSIGISGLCLAHCLFLPLLFVILPNLANSLLGGEGVHLLLVYTVIPSSLFALSMGCKQHRRGVFIVIGLFGLSFLAFGIAAEVIGLNQLWEKSLTVLGALLIAFAHLRNFQQCRESKNCACETPKLRAEI